MDFGRRPWMHFAGSYFQYFFDKRFKQTTKEQLFINILTAASLSNQKECFM